MSKKIGPSLCQSIVATHHLSGSDYTSKIGPKTAAIRADRSKFLLEFGRGKLNL